MVTKHGNEEPRVPVTEIENADQTNQPDNEAGNRTDINADSTITPKPITWSVGTGLVYVTYDQVQGELMAMDDYLELSKSNKRITVSNIVKGSNNLDFLEDPVQNEPNSDKDMKGHNTPVKDVVQKVEQMFVKAAQKNKCYVPLEKLQEDLMLAFQPSKCPPSIDPYSSLEDVGSTDHDSDVAKLSPTRNEEQTVNTKTGTSNYCMHERKLKRTRHSDKPMCETRKTINYTDLLDSGSDKECPKKKERKVKPVPLEPSSS